MSMVAAEAAGTRTAGRSQSRRRTTGPPTRVEENVAIGANVPVHEQRGFRSRREMREAGERGATGATGPRGATGRAVPERKPERSQSRRREVPRRLTGSGVGSPPHNYQAIIAAEYVAATLLVAISPIATRKAQASPGSGKLSPYLPADIVKLFAIGVVYLILEGMAAGPRGLARFSAWFGFLIFIAVGLSELAHIAQIFRVISGADVRPVELTAAHAPAVKGGGPVPPLGQAAPATSSKGGNGSG